MSDPTIIAWSAIAVLLFMTLVFAIATKIKNNGIVDIGWGIGFVMLVVLNLLSSSDIQDRQILISLLITLWGLRLAVHIFFRNRGKEEDFRYKAWRAEWQPNFLWKAYSRIYLLQGAMMLLIGSPILLVRLFGGAALGPIDLIGVAVWLIGFFFEAVGDYQLLMFKKDPSNKGKLMTSGVWSYTRHPNYFGEVAMWWGICIVMLSSNAGAWIFVSPIVITFLLLKVSGIPMLEKKYEGRADFEEYKKRTNAFWPGWGK